jgi:hypothetical protein
VRGGPAHYQALGRKGGAVKRRQRLIKTRSVRMGLLQIISTAEGRLIDADGPDGCTIDPQDRANIELALMWLRGQAADPV